MSSDIRGLIKVNRKREVEVSEQIICTRSKIKQLDVEIRERQYQKLNLLYDEEKLVIEMKNIRQKIRDLESQI